MAKFFYQGLQQKSRCDGELDATDRRAALSALHRMGIVPLKLSEAVKIMGFMKKDGHIDPDIYDLFIKSRLYYDYAKKEMDPLQID